MPGRFEAWTLLEFDYKEMLSIFNDLNVEYLVVGAHALAAHGIVRATGDLDLWIDPTAENAIRVIDALREFGAPLFDLSESDLTTPGTVFQIGVAPVRIDILTRISGVEFSEASQRCYVTRIEEVPCRVIGRLDLLRNKRATGRPKDLIDAEQLENQDNDK